MIRWFKRRRKQRVLKHYRIPDAEWNRLIESRAFLHGLDGSQLSRLRDLCSLFLHAKALEPVSGLELSAHDKGLLAVQACVPILELGLDWYRGWSAIIIYPDSFIGVHPEPDEAGVVHEHAMPQSGESWQRGPVILAVPDVRSGGQCRGANVVIHEMSHKLDMLNGDANGYPPLHADMHTEDWSRIFEAAYIEFRQYVDSGAVMDIDAYAAESPAEFFAVFSEYFFEQPAVVQHGFPDVYRQLVQFYRQDPVQRLSNDH